jgi:D-lactate dehydrogenase (cytochrome)
MPKVDIFGVDNEYEVYLADESRMQGSADTISFAREEADVIGIIKEIGAKNIPVTVQGSRTGIVGGASPRGGHVLNLSRMKRILGLRYTDGQFYITVQPGVLLSELRNALHFKKFDTQGWTRASMDALEKLAESESMFFPPDPTETSASIGGMVACNASGACSFYYGPTRKYVQAMHVVLADGTLLELKRGVDRADGRRVELSLDGGNSLRVELPALPRADVKNACGYYVEENMDLLDLFIGSEGTLGIVTEIDLRLLPAPKCVLGALCFFPSEKESIRFVRLCRKEKVAGAEVVPDTSPVAIEFFNSEALSLVRRFKDADVPAYPEGTDTAVYVEYHAQNDDALYEAAAELGMLLEACGSSDELSWIAIDDDGMKRLKEFRHCVPEAVNSFIDERRKTYPGIIKLSTDMAVPSACLEEVMGLYNGLKHENIDSVMFGHIGDNHIHVNIIPKDMEEYERGLSIYHVWAREVVRMGGTISAEHGIGKLKAPLFAKVYGDTVIKGMRRLKDTFDPQGILNPGNLFG